MHTAPAAPSKTQPPSLLQHAPPNPPPTPVQSAPVAQPQPAPAPNYAYAAQYPPGYSDMGGPGFVQPQGVAVPGTNAPYSYVAPFPGTGWNFPGTIPTMQPPYYASVPPHIPPPVLDSKAMISAFKTLPTLEGDNADTFPTWKISVATQLSTDPHWTKFVQLVKPAKFISPPVPSALVSTNNIMFAALKQSMDEASKLFIPDGISGGMELPEALSSALTPTLSKATILKYKNEISNPHRWAKETPSQYYLRLCNKQRLLMEAGVTTTIDTLSFTCGLANNANTVESSGRPAFEEEIINITKYEKWTST